MDRVGSLLPSWGKGCSMQTAGSVPASRLGMPLGPAYPSTLSPHPLPFPTPAPCLSPSLGTSQWGTGRGTRLVRWLGTYQHLPAAPLPFSSRPHPLKGLMHLPLSCCEMQRLKNSSTGSPGSGGEGGEGAFRSRRLSGWPQWPALHLNEDKGLTGSDRGWWGQ